MQLHTQYGAKSRQDSARFLHSALEVFRSREGNHALARCAQPMPGYRFNVRLGDNLTLDIEAQELPGIDEAAEEAKLILAELASQRF